MGTINKISNNEINERFKKEIDEYFENDARKLYKLVDKVLRKLKFHDVEVDEFYSLSHEIFYKSLKYYDDSYSFDRFMYSCLYKKFCTAMTKSNTKKRKSNKNTISIDSPIKNGDGDENSTIKDILAAKNTIESDFFSEREEGFSKEMTMYLSRLSTLQKQVLNLISIGFTARDIMEELHITKKQYEDCYSAIRSYRNISILM